MKKRRIPINSSSITIINGMQKHNCGGGYWGYIVNAKGLSFCGMCGQEISEVKVKKKVK